VSSEDLKSLQSNAFAALQQLVAQSPSVAALQMQLAQAQNQLRANGGTADIAPVVVGEQYLVFSLADREFAVKAEQVQGVERMAEVTPVPNVAPWIRGVMNLRGSIVSVIDFRLFLDLEQLPSTTRMRLLCLQYNEMVICLIVDSVNEMITIPTNSIVNGNVRQAAIPPWIASYSTGSALLTSRVVVLLDVPRLLFSKKMLHYGTL
jgi:purine-binding chemotaxis protein CheW